MVKCNKCGEVITSFSCDYKADVSTYYEYSEASGSFIIVDQNIDNDYDVCYSCCNCMGTLSEEVINQLKIK